MFDPTTLQRFLRENPRFCPPDYRFSVDERRRACPAVTEADPFYATCCLCLDLFIELRTELVALKAFGYGLRLFARSMTTLFWCFRRLRYRTWLDSSNLQRSSFGSSFQR